MSAGLLHLLRVAHVVGGAFWLGAAVLNTLFLVPTARALGPIGGQFVGHIVRVRKLPLWMNVAAWTTILSGVWLYGWRSAWFTTPWMHSASGIVYGLGGISAIVAALIGLVVIGPSAARLGRIGSELQAAGAPPPPEAAAGMQRLQRRMGAASLVAVILVVVAGLAMAVARYV